ncbi:MAG: hypothetical protein Q8S11_01900 [Daejeonella sp.]|uniref:hypothetical protein n=1 Tax=Daejeonella sp. TaxID=2805397 RepID=UPI00273636EC|nr:hypothetical protein [Daejeonella sp.]MDP3467056.1 hypothetical protein [Daejeonella sp.]
MDNQIINYSKMLPEFKRQAAQILIEKLPGHSRAGKAAINQFLQKKQTCLRGWHIALIFRFLSVAEFNHLFQGLRTAFSLKKLKSRGVGQEQIMEVTQLLIRLFKSLMINTSGAFIPEREQETDPGTREFVKPKEEQL